MGDFKLIIGRNEFNAEARDTWNATVLDNRDIHNQLAPPRSPELAAFYVINHNHIPRISMISCGKQEAKRVVYHKTNRHRANRRIFSWIGENIKEESKNYVIMILQANRMNPDNPGQKARVLDIARTAEESTGPGLITYRKYATYPTGKEIIDFFLITMEKARQLVYYKRNAKKVNTKEPKASGHYSLSISPDGTVQIVLLYSFKLQAGTFRFTSAIETDLRLWEVSAVRNINSDLFCLPLNTGTGDKTAIARDEFAKFYDIRQRRRADFAVRHPDAWVNRSNLAGSAEIDLLLSEANARILRRHGQRGVPRFTST